MSGESDQDWDWIDDDEWDDLWQTSMASTSNGQGQTVNRDTSPRRESATAASTAEKAAKSPSSKRPRTDLDHVSSDEDEEAFPAGQGWSGVFTQDDFTLADAAAAAAAAEEETSNKEVVEKQDPKADWSWPSSLMPLENTQASWIASTPLHQPGASTSKTPSRGRSSKRSLWPPEDLVSKPWSDLIQRHTLLIQQKGKIDNRQFNKLALELLNALATKARRLSLLTEEGSSPQTSTSDQWASEKAALIHFRAQLLSQKEQDSEVLVARVVDYMQTQLPPLMTADERKEALLKKSLAFVLELSPQLSLKTAPVIRTYVDRLFDSQLNDLFAEIRMPEMPVWEKALMYRRMLSNFLDDDRCITFAATNKSLLGKLTPRDLFFLTFYASVTSRRHRSDNLLQLGLTGTCKAVGGDAAVSVGVLSVVTTLMIHLVFCLMLLRTVLGREIVAL